MFSILEVTVRNVVNTINQIGVCKDIVDKFLRVTVPELIFGIHPLGYRGIVWAETINCAVYNCQGTHPSLIALIVV